MVLKCSKLESLKVNNESELKNIFNENDNGTLIVLDKITDPQNLGAIVRNSFYFGSLGIVQNSKNNCPLSPAVSKVSSGALEFINMFETNSIEFLLRNAIKNQIQILSTDSSSEESIDLYEFPKMKKQRIIILGSEGEGIGKPFIDLSSSIIKIKPTNQKLQKFPYSLIDSLNVGSTSAIVLNHFR